ncbi:hypothetical protein BJX68DRAFT_275258 [Aspergillus pseudodeflectus]|uniref:Xylanolytic transcriptional activator regulatory domain-containing protein n=1 Tax=Aspergillus pseudodeflectus TaxID=176178 RepID=A0ABR4KHD7_9EURO
MKLVKQRLPSSRKKRCIVPQLGRSCSLCTRKNWKCDLLNTATSFDGHGPARLGLPARPPPSQEVVQLPQPQTTPITPARSSNLPPPAICNELVDIYFDLIDEKQIIMFHRNIFITAQRAGQVPDFLVLGMIAAVARFSNNSFFDGIHPWDRGKPWLKAAIQAFYARSELIDLASLQGSILLSHVAYVEGDSAQEALLASQAIRMVQMLRLPENLSPDPIQREVEIRAFWEIWMIEHWDSGRTQIPRQLTVSPNFKRPLEEEVFRNMDASDPPERYSEANIEASGLRQCGLWSSMLAMSEIHLQVMRFNDEIVQNLLSPVNTRLRVREIAKMLDGWLHGLPSHLQDTPENRHRYASRGLGREFAVHWLVYHHQSQLLYYQFLNQNVELPEGRPDDEASMYADRCRMHAAALSQVMWDTHSVPGMECLWSPVNGHLLVVASSILLYTLLFDTDDKSIARARTLLEQNFIILLQFRKYWSYVELSMTRLRAFHRACQMNSTKENFSIDQWMIDFLNRYDAQISDRYSDDIRPPPSDAQIAGGNAPSVDLWLQLSEVRR